MNSKCDKTVLFNYLLFISVPIIFLQSSRSLLLAFSREFLKGEGDVTKHLNFLGYAVTHSQVSHIRQKLLTSITRTNFPGTKYSHSLRALLKNLTTP